MPDKAPPLPQLPEPGPAGAAAWLPEASEAVTAAVRSAIERNAASGRQRALLLAAVPEVDARGNAGHVVDAVHLPLLVHGACGEPVAPALPVACATTMIELGAYLLDHALDGELTGPWAGRTGAAVVVAALHGGPLARRALAEADVGAERLAELHCELDRGLLAIADGQALDVELAGTREPPPLDRLVEAARGKTGERRVMAARLAARLAGASDDVTEALARYASSYGIARQLASDAVDLAGSAQSRDLAAGTWTWPLAWHASRLDPAERERFLTERERAAGAPDAAERLAAEVRAGGALMRTALEARAHLAAAREALGRASPPEHVAVMLSLLLDAVDLGRAA